MNILRLNSEDYSMADIIREKVKNNDKRILALAKALGCQMEDLLEPSY